MIQYKDDEDDITISTNIETHKAVALAVQRHPAVLRLTIKNTGAALPPAAFHNKVDVDDIFAYRLFLFPSPPPLPLRTPCSPRC